MGLQKAIKLLEQEHKRAQEMCFVRNPLAWALYRVWKKADVQKDWDEDCIRDCKNCWKTKLAVVHGHWNYGTRAAICSECGFERNLDDNFGAAIACPNCGAKME